MQLKQKIENANLPQQVKENINKTERTKTWKQDKNKIKHEPTNM